MQVELARKIAAAFALAAMLVALETRAQDGQVSKSVAVPKPQPIAFSHKLHTQFIQKCGDCHAISEGDMTYPPESKCMQCHETIAAESPEIKKLTALYKEHKPVPWVQVYVLPDFVFFSHDVHHTKAKIDCETCHGAVRDRDVIIKEKPISMSACVDCHQMKKAPVKCDTCHNPNP